jgi:hypothetical protein
MAEDTLRLRAQRNARNKAATRQYKNPKTERAGKHWLESTTEFGSVCSSQGMPSEIRELRCADDHSEAKKAWSFWGDPTRIAEGSQP